MAIQTINIGNIANDGTGDDLRAAFVKVNSNFTEIDQRIPAQADGTNLGSGEGIFYVKEGNALQFKSLVEGTNISLTSTANEITINSAAINSIQFDANVGSFTLTAAGGLNFIGGQNIDTTITSNDVTFAIDGENLVVQDTSPTLGGDLDADGNNIINAASINSTSFVGDLTGLVYGHDIRFLVNGVGSSLINTDLGNFSANLTTGFDLLVASASIDYGTYATPASFKSDYGSFISPL